ncbi:MAG: hypothetical protein RL660_2527 [Bacteroidota bacterium]|jgi:hypothetical protein
MLALVLLFLHRLFAYTLLRSECIDDGTICPKIGTARNILCPTFAPELRIWLSKLFAY